MSKRVAVDKATKNLVETTYKETMKQLEEVRDSAISEAKVICNVIWKQNEPVTCPPKTGPVIL